MIKSTVVLLITLCALPLLRRQSAAMRHAVLTVGLICAIAVPIVSSLLPSEVSISHGLNGFSGFQSVESVQSVANTDPEVVPPPSIEAIASAVWVSGVAVAGFLILVGAVRILWLAFRAKPVADTRWLACAVAVSKALKLQPRVRLPQNHPTSLPRTFRRPPPRLLLP